MFATVNIKDQMNTAANWAASGTKLTYAAIAVGVVIGLVLFRFFFKGVGGFFHSIGFSVGSSGSDAAAAEPGLSSSSRLKLLLITVLPPAFGYAAYLLLPKWLPSVFH